MPLFLDDLELTSAMTEADEKRELLKATMRALTKKLLACLESGDNVSMEENDGDGTLTYMFKVIAKK